MSETKAAFAESSLPFHGRSWVQVHSQIDSNP